MGNCLCIKVERSAIRLKSKSRKEILSVTRSGVGLSHRSSAQSHTSAGQPSAFPTQPATELLERARESLAWGSFPHVDAATLCSLALAASAGVETLETWCEDIMEMRLGVCQMTASAAQSLASNQGALAFGWPTKQTLLSAVPAMYFAAALLEELFKFGSTERSVCFCVKAFYAGPKAVNDEEALDWPASALAAEIHSERGLQDQLVLLWHNFKVARQHVRRIQNSRSPLDGDFIPMHIVQKDETLASIAKVCQVTGQELRRLNPDMPAALKCGDCIALPEPCLPQLFCIRRNESWAGVATLLHMPPSKLRVHNAEALVVKQGSSILASLANSSILLEGQLIEVPGMGNGTSECSDESRMEDLYTDFMTTQQLFGFGQRPPSVVVGHFESPLEVQHASGEIVDASME